MAYRGDGASDALEAPTADGKLRVELGPRHISLVVADRALHVTDKFATVIDGKRQESLELAGRLIAARDVPREDLGIWIELIDTSPGRRADGKPAGMRRIFGVAPLSTLEPGGLAALQRLDAVAYRVRTAVADFSGDVRRAIEIGRGLDKVLLAEHADHHAIYARRLFRDRARLAVAIYPGRIVIVDGKTSREVAIPPKALLMVTGDMIRFADRHGTDLGQVAIPWIAREDREELARRIGQLVEPSHPASD
jgi:hypothetical protein